MKKKIVTLIVMATMVLGLVGCGTKTECDWCGEEARCKTYQNAFLGEMDLCSECQKDMGLK